MTVIVGDCLEVLPTLPEQSVNCVVTSPPYFGLRDYDVDGQIGLEETPAAYVAKMVEVFRLVHRVLRDDGTLWVNLGDSYSHGGCGARDSERWPKQSRNDHMATHQKKNTGLPPKSLLGMPWRVAFALQDDGWILRQDIVWEKPAPMPESVKDRCTRSHEYVFMFTKRERYFYDADAICEPATHAGKIVTLGEKSLSRGQANGARVAASGNGTADSVIVKETRNKRSVWRVSASPFPEAHFATFPPDLIRPMILAGCPSGGTVLDPFGGSGTTRQVAEENGRQAILIELNPEYAAMADRRRKRVTPALPGVL